MCPEKSFDQLQRQNLESLMVQSNRVCLLLMVSVLIALGGLAHAQTEVRQSSFTYYAAGHDNEGLLKTEVVEPHNASYRVTTTHIYDVYGNTESVTTSGADFSTRTSTTDYHDTSTDRGQFPQIVTNALGHQETWNYDKRFGQPTRQTGPNMLSSTWIYDEFGRTRSEKSPDDTYNEYTYGYCAGVANGSRACPAHAVYFVEASSHAPGGALNGPITTVYNDSHGREVASDTQGFDGRVIRVVTIYDAMGRTERESKPFYHDPQSGDPNNGTPSSGDNDAWTRYTFDPLGRVTEVTLPGGRTETTHYNGLTVTQTNALGQTTTTTKNDRGEVKSITHNANFADAGNDTDITTHYAYSPSGNLTHITDADGNVSETYYDWAGRKRWTDDPTMGLWTYNYNALGELIEQTDAEGQVTTMTYDLLGRPRTRTDADGVSTWTYDTQAKGVGKLATATRGTHTREVFYDSLGRANRMDSTLDGVTETFSVTFDASSRVDQVTYPSGLVTETRYNTWGYEYQLVNATTSDVLWTANARDQELRLIRETAGNGVETRRTFDAAKGTLDTMTAGLSNVVADFSYQFDEIGNLTQRADGNENWTENFCYDEMNRLVQYGLVNLGNCTGGAGKTVSYDRIGNITFKSDVGHYTYSGAGPHAVTRTDGTLNEDYFYDANGNMELGAGRTITWAAFNKVSTILDGGITTAFTYDADSSRVKMSDSRGATFYFAAFGVMAEKLVKTGSTDTKWTNYLFAGGAMVGVEITDEVNGTVQAAEFNYFVTDHLGSIAVITDELGVVIERLSYDAWGKRRYPDGGDDINGTLTSSVMSRGFTGHEMLDDTDLVQMNGRIYDPSLGKFLSADPFIQDVLIGASLNRYSYVWNNPLSYTDPSGHFVGTLFAVGTLIASALLAPDIIDYFQDIALDAFFTGVFTLACGGNALCGAVISSAIVTGINGGDVSDMFKASAFRAANFATTEAFNDWYSTDLQADFYEGNAKTNPGRFKEFDVYSRSGDFVGKQNLRYLRKGEVLAQLKEPGLGVRWRIAGSKVAIRGTLGGVQSVTSGGKFGRGFAFAATSQTVRELQGYMNPVPSTLQNGSGYVSKYTGKEEDIVYVQGAGDLRLNNIGSGVSNVDSPAWSSEGGLVGRNASRSFMLGGEALANYHDPLMDVLRSNFGQSNALNFGTMAPAWVIGMSANLNDTGVLSQQLLKEDQKRKKGN